MSDINKIFERFPSRSREDLIPLLQDIQAEYGYISEENLVAISKYLNIPAAKIYGVATFYNQFRFHPKGKYHIQVCRGTACHILGSKTVLEELQNLLKIRPGETTNDGLFSLEVVACLGACGLAPVIVINGEFHGKVTQHSIRELIEDIQTSEKAIKAG